VKKIFFLPIHQHAHFRHLPLAHLFMDFRDALQQPLAHIFQ
jgi:hypothetical protein